MDTSENILLQIEKTSHLIRNNRLNLFREKKYPVSLDQWTIMERIAENEGSNQKDIARDTFKDPAALTRMLDLLVDKGFVQRKSSKKDRRTFDIYLTVEGGRLIKRIQPMMNVMNSEIEKQLETAERRQLAVLLSKLN